MRRSFALLLLLVLVVVVASTAGYLVWGDAPMQLADDQLIWGD